MFRANCSTSSSADRGAGARGLAQVLLCGVAVLCVAGCGFHLRGTAVRADVGAVHVVPARNVPLEAALVRAIGQSGSTIVADRSAADLVIELAEQKEARRTLSFTDRARTAEYEFTLSLRYRVIAADGRELVPERAVVAARTFRVDRDNLAASSQEEALLKEELGDDVVQQVVRSLDAAARTLRGTAG